MRGAYLKHYCIRVVEIDEDASLYDLHNAIQDAVKFDRDHPFEFFIANSPSSGATRHRLTYREKWEEKEDDFCRIRLKDIYPLGRRRLYYWFDFGDQWIFEVRKTRGSKNPEPGVKHPRVIEAIGPDPEQYPRFCE